MYTVLIASIFWTLASKGPAAFAMAKQQGGYDNGEPRHQMTTLEGWGRRSVAAHQNGWEAMLIQGLAIAMVVATGHAEDPTAVGLAWGWIGLRVLYTGIYVAGYGTLRTLVWALAIACSMGLIGVAAGWIA